MRRLYEASAYDLQPDPLNFWNSTVPPDRLDAPPLDGDTQADFAVIGAGYTGLSAALRLAETHGASVVVVDRSRPGWGASGRNGGFVCLGGSKRSEESLLREFGVDETARYRACQRDAIDHVAATLDRFGIDADRHSDGEWEIAHTKGHADALRRQAEAGKRKGSEGARFFEPDELASLGIAAPFVHGGSHLPAGFAINPLKYVAGLLAAVRDADARVYGQSEITGIEPIGDGYRLRSATGSIAAKRLIVATNGYGAEDLVPGLAGRLLPAFSNILVTEPMDEATLAAQGWTRRDMAYDSRNLLHYFRLMPDGRFLFGMRGGTSHAPAAVAEMRQAIRRDFEAMFPAWRQVETPWFWSGLVCLTRSLTQYLGKVDGWSNAWASAAYHGNGVAMGSHAGRLVADLGAGAIDESDIPAVMRGGLKPFPLPALRRTYLKAAYAWFGLVDR
ncbi:FAD-binding oxidoreductase [Stappia sp. F7233]|uniref:FAD-binding oxidoreductase n=1 Tax=Stappia albiluteola TaxID=2758565 RepID=A0A839AGD4_9HYPH|nr:FAD-dependent oxidoreductase [Stappia albiluteola]MBA5778763.1 FAD-binding oxidoreductase [Stappia albiluteola]